MPYPSLPNAFEGARLRPWTQEDAPQLLAAWNDAEIARWNGVPPEPTLAVAQRWISGVDARFRQNTSIDLVIEADDLGEHPTVFGEVGISGMSARHRGALIGYWLLPQARKRGFASAAVRSFAEWAHTDLGLHQLVARCAADNLASQAVARRAGFVHEANGADNEQLWKSRARGG